MITRIWRGVVRTEDATEYVRYVQKTGIVVGVDPTRAVYYPEDDRFLLECNARVEHYDIA